MSSTSSRSVLGVVAIVDVGVEPVGVGIEVVSGGPLLLDGQTTLLGRQSLLLGARRVLVGGGGLSIGVGPGQLSQVPVVRGLRAALVERALVAAAGDQGDGDDDDQRHHADGDEGCSIHGAVRTQGARGRDPSRVRRVRSPSWGP